jgi:hypothetical protein
MKLDLKAAATSLVVASTNLLLSGVGLLLGFHTPYGEWAVVLFMVLVPPLFVATLVFFVRDVMRKTTRRQAILALLFSLPTLVVESWFYNWFRGW